VGLWRITDLRTGLSVQCLPHERLDCRYIADLMRDMEQEEQAAMRHDMGLEGHPECLDTDSPLGNVVKGIEA